jgi:hypothetical protein|tara:strand:- start:1316 stop:1516 length:201 start_codon:yes stop_codon:yes gene_type:complete
MSRGQSFMRKINRGNLQVVSNKSFERLDFYRKISNGRFVLTDPKTYNSTLGNSISFEQLRKLQGRN